MFCDKFGTETRGLKNAEEHVKDMFSILVYYPLLFEVFPVNPSGEEVNH